MAGALRYAFLFTLLLLAFPVAGLAASLRIVHVMSYHGSWEWNREQWEAFKEELKGMDVEYRVVELDAKRASKERVQAHANDAIHLIETWKPHLVYANDDPAQELVTRRFINTPIPFVYSGVNKEPRDYGFEKASNVTGILEQEHFVATVNLLRQFKPGVHKIAVITDRDPTWQGVLQRIRRQTGEVPEVVVTDWLRPDTFEEYKAHIKALQGKVDAVALLGVFNFSHGEGYADYQDVLRWTAENSRLPDFSFWSTRVERGTLCAVTVSGVEQGRQAGIVARQILVDKIPPYRIEPRPTIKGKLMVSLARARELGIKLPASVLLSSEVVTQHAWTK